MTRQELKSLLIELGSIIEGAYLLGCADGLKCKDPMSTDELIDELYKIGARGCHD